MKELFFHIKIPESCHMDHLDQISPEVRIRECERVQKCDDNNGILKTEGMRRRTLLAGALSLLIPAGCGGGSEGTKIGTGVGSGGELKYVLVRIPPLSGDNTVNVAGINNLGLVVGNSSILPDTLPPSFFIQNSRAFIWNGSLPFPLPTLPGFETGSRAIAINDVGTILGIIGKTPVLWEGGNHRIRQLPELIPYMYDLFGLNNNGTILTPTITWNNGVVTQLPKVLPYFYPTAFNDSGMVAGFRENFPGTPPQYPVILKDNTFTSLPYFPVSDGQHRGGQPNDINNRGLAVGQSYSEISPTEVILRAVSWENGNITDLSKLFATPAKNSNAVSVNNNGDIVGDFTTTNSNSASHFLYKDGAMRDLQAIANETIPGILKRINDRGEIQLTGFNAPSPDSILRPNSLL